MTEQILPDAGTVADPTTSLEHAHRLAIGNLKRAQDLRAQAVAAGASPARLDELSRLEELAMQDLQRTRSQL